MTLLGKEVLLQLSYRVLYICTGLWLISTLFWVWNGWDFEDFLFFFLGLLFLFRGWIKLHSAPICQLCKGLIWSYDGFHYWKHRPSLCWGRLQNKKLVALGHRETCALHPRDFRTNIWRLGAQLVLDTQEQEKAPVISSNLMALLKLQAQ